MVDMKLINGSKLATDPTEGVVLVIPYKDSLDFRVCQEKKLKYIKDLTSMICLYRVALMEPRCKYFIDSIKQ